MAEGTHVVIQGTCATNCNMSFWWWRSLAGWVSGVWTQSGSVPRLKAFATWRKVTLTEVHRDWECGCGPCPSLNFTLPLALQLRQIMENRANGSLNDRHRSYCRHTLQEMELTCTLNATEQKYVFLWRFQNRSIKFSIKCQQQQQSSKNENIFSEK